MNFPGRYQIEFLVFYDSTMLDLCQVKEGNREKCQDSENIVVLDCTGQ